jgi:hypothetical protein
VQVPVWQWLVLVAGLVRVLSIINLTALAKIQ